MKLQWSQPSPPNDTCHYNHTRAETTLGTFLLTWKGWKESSGYGFDETPWGEVVYLGWSSVEEACLWAEEQLKLRCEEVLAQLYSE